MQLVVIFYSISEIRIYKTMLEPALMRGCETQLLTDTGKSKFMLNTWERGARSSVVC
jgi:hypothetical protein